MTESVSNLDLRGLEPPQPLVRALEAAARLPVGSRLEIRTDRRPMHLYAQLDQRGLQADSTEQPDGSWITCIRHA